MKKTLAILLLAGSTLLAGCGDSREEFVFSGNNITASTPIARNDAYTTTQNVAVAIPAVQGVLTNDTLNAGPNSNITVAYQPTTTQGGTVTATNNFGAFTYTPANGFVGSDSFTYTLSNGFSSATATVTITVNAAQVTQGYFVDSANGSDTNGSFQTGTPFQTIGAAVTAAGPNQDIVVRPGTYTGTVTLLNGQRLLGSGSALVNTQGTVKPLLNGRIILADGNTVDSFRIEGSNGDAIDGDDQNGGTVTNTDIANTTNIGSGIDAASATGSWKISNNTITNVSGAGVILSSEMGDAVTAQINDNTITGSAFNALGFVSSDNSTLTVQANDNTMTGNQAGATFEIIVADTSTACFQILDNQNDDVYRLSVLDTPATLNIEQYNSLETLNSGDILIPGGSVEDPTPVADGACGF